MILPERMEYSESGVVPQACLVALIKRPKPDSKLAIQQGVGRRRKPDKNKLRLPRDTLRQDKA
jgi:hypothetical protein